MSPKIVFIPSDLDTQLPNAVVKSDFVIKLILFQSTANPVGIPDTALYVLVQFALLSVFGRQSGSTATFAELVLIVVKSVVVKAVGILAGALYVLVQLVLLRVLGSASGTFVTFAELVLSVDQSAANPLGVLETVL
jgi:hypothetical protein